MSQLSTTLDINHAMKQDIRFPHYVTNEQTVGANHDVDPLDNRMRVKSYHENLILSYA